MTILTAANAEKPKEAQVLINPETLVKVEFKKPNREAAVKQHKVHAAINDLIRSRRRRYLALNIVVAIASLLVVVTGIFGGMYIYKWISHSNKVAAQGSCTVRYHDEMRIEGYAQAQVQQSAQPKPSRRGYGADEARRKPEPGAPRRSSPQQSNNRPYGSTGRFVEKYNVLNPSQEILQVPQLGLNNYNVPITVIHDFAAKLTAIVDMWNYRCFIKPLDPKVVPPRDFVDLIRRVEDGSYVPNVCMIRKHYRARQPPLDTYGLTELRSEIISRSCSSLLSYMLVRIDTPSTLPPSTTRRMLIGGGLEDFDRPMEDDSEDDPPVVLGGDSDPDNPRYQARRQRAKRDVESSDKSALSEEVPIDLQLDTEPKSVAKKGEPAEPSANSDVETGTGTLLGGGDADDVVINMGFDGAESVELAQIHFDEQEDSE